MPRGPSSSKAKLRSGRSLMAYSIRSVSASESDSESVGLFRTSGGEEPSSGFSGLIVWWEEGAATVPRAPEERSPEPCCRRPGPAASSRGGTARNRCHSTHDPLQLPPSRPGANPDWLSSPPCRRQTRTPTGERSRSQHRLVRCSMVVRAHQRAAGPPKEGPRPTPADHALRRSRGEPITPAERQRPDENYRFSRHGSHPHPRRRARAAPATGGDLPVFRQASSDP